MRHLRLPPGTETTGEGGTPRFKRLLTLPARPGGVQGHKGGATCIELGFLPDGTDFLQCVHGVDLPEQEL